MKTAQHDFVPHGGKWTPIFGIFHDLYGDHEAPAFHPSDVGVPALERAQLLHEVCAHGRGMVHEAAVQKFNRRQSSRTGDRVAAKRIRMRTARPCHEMRPRENRTHGQSRSDALGQADNVRLDARMLIGKPSTRTAKTGLDLVHDEQKAVPVRKFA